MYSSYKTEYITKVGIKLEIGMYVVLKQHGGYSGMAKYFMFNLTYDVDGSTTRPDHPNAFVRARNLLSNESGNPTYDLEYNPQTRIVRTVDTEGATYHIYKIKGI